MKLCILNNMPLQQFIHAKFYALRHGCSLYTALVQRGIISETQFYQRAAQMLGVPFDDTNQLARHQMELGLSQNQPVTFTNVRARLEDGTHAVICAPNVDGLLAIETGLQNKRLHPDTVRLSAPHALRTELLTRYQPRLVRQATHALHTMWPQASSQKPVGRSLPFILFLALCTLTLWGFFNGTAQIALLAISIVFFMLPAIMRFALALYGLNHRNNPIRPLCDPELPIYSILIPLVDEANMVPQMVDAMTQLDYPRTKLDIKFVVEAHCKHTIEAVCLHATSQEFDLIVVPSSKPQTKPKALNYALPLCKGAHVVVYDAEDIPHPKQLREVATLFANDPALGCVQAELHIDNANESFFTRHFAAEYATQFAGILPGLARLNQPMPLGGTSNHFRTSQLRQMGAWDAFNVTEDADLGMRLARLGKKCATLSTPTYEEAPVHFTAWYKQRTRWLKGWMQTWLAHSSNPFRLLKELGWIRFLVFQLLIGGMILSTPLHIILVIATISGLFLVTHQLNDPIFTSGLMILITGYAATIAGNILGLKVLKRRIGIIHLLGLPLYWACTSFAAVRAAIQLCFDPFKWEKTPHGITRQTRTKASDRNFN